MPIKGTGNSLWADRNRGGVANRRRLNCRRQGALCTGQGDGRDEEGCKGNLC